MKGKVARAIRKLAGYDEHSFRHRTYTREGRTIIADSRRRLYQKMKKDYKEEKYANNER